jgi:small subunit ribosomal protein S20
MPVLKHAKKKQRQDKKRMLKNKKEKVVFKDLVKKAKATKSAKDMNAAFKAIDKAAKKNLIHKNKAARLKSSLSKLTNGKAAGAPKKAIKADATKAQSKTKKPTKTKGKATANKSSAKSTKISKGS